jgi:tetratricopeptide (TPR) repeat protein
MRASQLFRRGIWIVISCGAMVVSAAQSKDSIAPPRLMSGLGEVHHPVSTKNREAQQFFDQGLKLVYGFNHDEARKSFRHAADLDPKLAMAWWGVALTLGPNYNLPVDPEREKAGYDAVQRAIALKENASEPESAYIDALAVRYSNDPKGDLHALDRTYEEAMSKLAARYPDDLDAATLYAESAMNLNPWHLWTADGKPAEGTEEIVWVLESVLKRDPNHLGANHYYIHAVEASPHPERALPSAARLEKLAPAAGHLVHLPAHI